MTGYSISRSSTLSALSTCVGEDERKIVELNENICATCYTPLPSLHTQLSDCPQYSTSGREFSTGDFLLKTIAGDLKVELETRLSASRRSPRVVGILATTDHGCRSYASATAKACFSNGIDFEIRDLTETSRFQDVKKAIEDVNSDLDVDGLIVYFPIFGYEKDQLLRSFISTRIDVEGVHPYHLSISSLSPPLGDEKPTVVYPCTPLAAVRVLRNCQNVYNLAAPSGQRLKGKVVTIFNRSATVGRPLAEMLSNEGATVFSIDLEATHVYHRHHPNRKFCIRAYSALYDRAECLALSDVIVSAVPDAKFKIPTLEIRPGAVCVNIASGNNFEESVNERAGVFVKRLGNITQLTLQLNAVMLSSRESDGVLA